MKGCRTQLGLLIGLFTACGLGAQSLSIPPMTVMGGEPASLYLVLQTPPGKKAPVALQWHIRFPAGAVVEAKDIRVGSTAESVQKSLACAIAKGAKPAPEFGNVFVCMLAGGQKPLPDGTVAVARYRIPVELRRQELKARVEAILGVTVDLEKLSMPAAEGTVSVK